MNIHLDEAAAFMRAIVADPDRDEPRLIYADWLEERGDPRCELIRIQCELAKERGPKEELEKLRQREAALLAAHFEDWTAALDSLPHYRNRYMKFERGILSNFSIRPAKFLTKSTQKVLAQQLPVVGCYQLRFWDHTKQISRLAACETLSWFVGLRWFDCLLEDEHLQEFFASPNLLNLRGLALNNVRGGIRGLSAIADASFANKLSYLQLLEDRTYMPDYREGFGRLLHQLPKLETLSLGFGDSSLSQFVAEAGHALSQLKRLSMPGGDPKDFMAIATCPHFTSLEGLTINSRECAVDDACLRAMIENPAFANLKFFDFQHYARDSSSWPFPFAIETVKKLRQRFPEGKPEAPSKSR